MVIYFRDFKAGILVVKGLDRLFRVNMSLSIIDLSGDWSSMLSFDVFVVVCRRDNRG